MKHSTISFLIMLPLLLCACTEKMEYKLEDKSSQTNVAEEYYSHLETIVSSVFCSDEICESALGSPMYDKLKSISIIDDSGKTISFFDLPSDERSTFFEQYAELNIGLMCDKFKSMPSAEEYVKAQNAMVDGVLAEHSIMSKTTGGMVIDNPQDFFSDLNAISLEFSKGYVIENPEVMTKSDIVYDPDRIISTYAGIARRGDFIIGLPDQENPSRGTNKKAEMYPQGHAEIIVTDVTPGFKDTDIFTVGTLSDGVMLRTLGQCWFCQSNVIGVEIYDYIWEKLKLTKVKREIDTDDIASYAEMFSYTPHIEDYESLISKWVAPKHFTDATLLWWTMKELYDVELGSWLLASISAADIYNSEYTYLKATVN